MKERIYGPYARLVRWAVRLGLRRWSPVEEDHPPAPAVFVVHHQNLAGPVLSAALLPRQVRIWVLDVFFTRRDCFAQYYGYTFTRRFGWPRPLAFCAALPLSLLIPPLIRSLNAIPVHRGDRRIMETLDAAAAALAQGESVLVCPDLDYASREDATGALYQGFLHLERRARRAGAPPLAYVPVCCARRTQRFVLGRPLYFPGNLPFKAGQKQMASALGAALNQLNQRYNPTGEDSAC